MASSGGMQDILMGKALGLPYETQTDQSALQRKRRLVQMMLQQAMGDTSPLIDTGAVKVANWSGPLNKIIAAYFGGKLGNDVDAEEKGLAGENAKRRQKEVGIFSDLMQGGVEPQGPMPDGSAMPATKPDTVAAMVHALRSGDPALQKVGTDWAETQAKGQITPLKRFEAASSGKVLPPSVGGDPEAMQLTPHIVTDNGVTGQVTPGQPGFSQPPVPVTTFRQEAGSPGMPPVNVNELTGEKKGITGGNVTPPDGQAFNKGLQEADIKMLVEGKSNAEKAWTGLHLVGSARAQLEALPPEVFGTAAGVRVGLNQLMTTLGFPSVDSSVGLEKLGALMGERMLERLKLFAPVSNTDKDEMKLIAGSAANTKEGLESIITFAEKVLARQINTANEFASSLEKQPGYNNLDRYKSWKSVVGDTPTGFTPSGKPPLVLDKYKKRGP